MMMKNSAVKVNLKQQQKYTQNSDEEWHKI